MNVVFFDGVPYSTKLSGTKIKAVRQGLQEARKAVAGLQTSLRKAKGSPEATELAKSYIYDTRVILCAAVAANKGLKPGRRESLETVIELPDIFDPSVPMKLAAEVYFKTKKSGDKRPIWNFPLPHRTAQVIAAQLMAPHIAPKPWQYTLRGVPHATTKIRALVADGYRYVARLDIANFFGSFDHEKLPSELPLPWELVEHVVSGRHLAAVMAPSRTGPKLPPTLLTPTLLHLARRGIPQGSCSSPIVAAFILSRLQCGSTTLVVLVNYGDDFLLLARSEAALAQHVVKLTDAVCLLPGGHFNLKLAERGHIDQGISFLGRRLRRIGTVLEIKPTTRNLELFHANVEQIETRLQSAMFLLGDQNWHRAKFWLEKLHAFTLGWHRSFSDCDGIQESRIAWLGCVETYAEQLGLSLSEVEAAIDPAMTFSKPECSHS